MRAFTSVTGVAAALPRANLDTDQIMPKQFLKGIDRQGLGEGFLYDLRFAAPGRARPDFVLNRDPWNRAAILLTGPNFGCGSSREHAVWGLLELGVRSVIGTSFGGIFADNCARNGVPAISVEPRQLERMMALAADPAACEMTVDLNAQQIITPADGTVLRFEFDPLRRHMLINGLDAVGLTLQYRDEIERFERVLHAREPWLA